MLFPAKQNMFKWEILLHPQNVINIWFFRLYLIYKYEICIWETACSFACDNQSRSTNSPSARAAWRKKRENNPKCGELSPQDCVQSSEEAALINQGQSALGSFITGAPALPQGARPWRLKGWGNNCREFHHHKLWWDLCFKFHPVLCSRPINIQWVL